MEKEIALNYIVKKKRKKRARIISLISSIVIAIFILIAFCVIYVDRFTITINDSKSLYLTIDESREILTTKLEAPPLLKASDIQYSGIPSNIDDGVGSKNSNDYFAYSFYLGCNESTNYSLTMTLDNYSNGIEEAIRIMIIRNQTNTIYSKNKKPIYDGDRNNPEEKIEIGKTTPFKENKHIILEPYSIAKDTYDKYTIVMWIDGWESTNSMKGGIIQTNIEFSTLSTNI